MITNRQHRKNNSTKIASALAALLTMALFLQSCAPSQKVVAMDSPEATFATLKSAIEDRDIETYEKLWHPGRVEKEGMISKIKADPGVWDEIEGLFKGETTITDKKFSELDGNKTCRINISAPEADHGGIGAISLILVDDNWLLWTW